MGTARIVEHRRQTENSSKRMPPDSCVEHPSPSAASTEILALQWTIGNQAVMRVLREGRLLDRPGAGSRRHPARIQRLTAGAQLLHDTDAANATFQAIGALLDQYNVASLAMPQNAVRLNSRFDLLRQIDRSIYHWFGTVSQAHLRLSGDPHTTRMQALLSETETEFINLVHQTKNDVSIFPFDIASVPGPQQAVVTQLWQSLVQGTGKINLVGSAAHQRKSIAELAKLLNTASGRELLRYLNTPSAAAPLHDPLTNIYIGDDVNLLDPAVRNASPGLGDRNQSEAQPLGNAAPHDLGAPQPLDGTEDMVNDFVLLNNPADFRTAVLTGKRGVVLNGNKYLFSQGTGAFVKTVADTRPGVGQNVEQIVKAGFVTLGHELGHAAHMRGGATTLPEPAVDERAEFMNAFSGRTPADTKLFWDNSEEFLNIMNTENPIRAGEQMSLSGAHKTQGAILRSQRKSQIVAILGVVFNLDPIVEELSPYRTLASALVGNLERLDDDAFFNQLLLAAQQLQNRITPAYVQASKRERLQNEFRLMQTAVAASGVLGRLIAARNKYYRIAHEIQNNLNAYLGPGQHNQYLQLQTDIRDLKTL
jgi:hypothetical protein